MKETNPSKVYRCIQSLPTFRKYRIGTGETNGLALELGELLKFAIAGRELLVVLGHTCAAFVRRCPPRFVDVAVTVAVRDVVRMRIHRWHWLQWTVAVRWSVGWAQGRAA